jgi:glycosyltransferase involved in cell wall biosynthesis
MNSNTTLTVIILTYNESIHIRRVMENAWQVASEVLIIDSFSTDETVAIAESFNARVLQHPFKHQADQLEWAMENANIQSDWILRIDADEFLLPETVNEIKTKLPSLPTEITGVIFKRRVYFMGQWMRHGGYYPVKLLRLWRRGKAQTEQRWMDEHTYLTEGSAVTFEHDLVDDNQNNLAWWTQKHNQYSTREAIELLSKEFDQRDPAQFHDINVFSDSQAARKRWLKKNLYLRLPLFIRCLIYYQFRYIVKLGFLDGKKGLVFHFLQGCWYRMLIDAKLWQIKQYAKQRNKSYAEIIREEYNITV